ncbi:MAG: HutD family protein [Gammaproteobacteria bacterium]|nr:HutD family protein [Gammaproteobacteria bacterium]MBV9621983.1 HutD family protein [Gammaproteobacteria bacterium]
MSVEATRLPAAARRASPWRNGGGLTYEVAIHPPHAGLDDFDWRVSVAHIARGGPFSLYPGIERQLLLLEGCLHLTVGGGCHRLSADSPPLVFDGGAAASAAPQGRVHDLNVMTRVDRYRARIRRCRLRDPQPVAPRDEGAVLLFALEPCEWVGGEGVLTLEPWDALRLGTVPGELRPVHATARFCEIRLGPVRPEDCSRPQPR